MKQFVVTRAQKQALQHLSRGDLAAIRRNPNLVSGSKHLLVACKKIIKKIESIPRHAGHKKRETAFKRVITLCQKAIEKAEH